MSEKSERKGRRWTAPLFALAVLTGVYVGGYFTLGEYSDGVWEESVGTVTPIHARLFPRHWLQQAYIPLGWIEFHLRGRDELICFDNKEGVGEQAWFYPPHITP